jgi:pyrimidine-specific ribonucleoside hydrolase
MEANNNKTYCMKRLPILLLTFIFISSHLSAQQKKPVSIIFDTDIGPDYDDVGAITLLHALADSGEAKILATMASNVNPPIVAVLNIFNTYFNRPQIPIGIPKGSAVNLPAKQKWDSIIVTKYPHAVRSNDEATDAVLLYREILSKQPNQSVVIVTVGFLTNLANLLNSNSDRISPLTGKELVKKKVKQLVSMAGKFPSGKEFNVDRDIAASQKVIADWPTPIIFSGFEIGVEILTGLPLINNNSIQNSPVKEVFSISIPFDPQDKNGRMSWDETAVLVAVRGWEKYYTLHPGRFVINADGSNSWDSTGKGHQYLVRKMPVAEMTALINQLIMHQPVKR